MNEDKGDYALYDAVIASLNALEQAIVDICDIDTVHMIQERKKEIQKK